MCTFSAKKFNLFKNKTTMTSEEANALDKGQNEITQEEKELLLKDLCARLPYKQKVYYKIHNNNEEITETLSGCLLDYFKTGKIAVVKPYLRPMSSMTEEEEAFVYNGHIEFWEREDYCNKHYLDYRGLIPIRHAIEAPEGMYTVLCRNINAKTDIREKTPFFDKNVVRIYDGDVFVYLKYTNFKDGVPSDLIENYSKYENEVVLHPVFWYDNEKSWCSDVYGIATIWRHTILTRLWWSQTRASIQNCTIIKKK